MLRNSWLRIPASYTGWTFFTYICCKNCNDACLIRPKINDKRGRGWPIKKIHLLKLCRLIPTVEIYFMPCGWVTLIVANLLTNQGDHRQDKLTHQFLFYIIALRPLPVFEAVCTCTTGMYSAQNWPFIVDITNTCVHKKIASL